MFELIIITINEQQKLQTRKNIATPVGCIPITMALREKACMMSLLHHNKRNRRKIVLLQ